MKEPESTLPKQIDLLICEDDPYILESIVHTVRMEGFTSLTTETGKNALEMARRFNPRILLLDLMLPDMDGLRVCRELKKDPETSRMVILVLTARGQDADIQEGLAAGADEYITKPYSPRALCRKLHRLLD